MRISNKERIKMWKCSNWLDICGFEYFNQIGSIPDNILAMG